MIVFHACQSEADDLLLKPYQLSALAQKVRSVLDQR